MPSFFSKEYITAEASYNRWLVPPAALAIHPFYWDGLRI